MNKAITNKIDGCLRTVQLYNCSIDWDNFTKIPFHGIIMYSYSMEIPASNFLTTGTWNTSIVNNRIEKLNKVLKERIKACKVCVQYIGTGKFKTDTEVHVIFN